MQGSSRRAVQGDITDPGFLERLFARVEDPGLFLNLCPALDNLVLRRRVAARGLAYLDFVGQFHRGGAGRVPLFEADAVHLHGR